MPTWLRDIARSSEGQATRSTALQPLLWLISATLTAVAGCAIGKAEAWLLEALFVVLATEVLVCLAVYVMFAIKCTDALRSEKFLLHKMELEQAAIGDDLMGVIDQPITPKLPIKRANSEGPAEQKGGV